MAGGGVILASAGPGIDGHSATATEASHFAGYLGRPFRLRGSSGAACDVVLTRVDELPRRPAGGPSGRVPFSLTFRGPVGRALPQDVYRVDRAGFGTSHLLLVPIGPPGDRTVLEAIFG